MRRGERRAPPRGGAPGPGRGALIPSFTFATFDSLRGAGKEEQGQRPSSAAAGG